MEEVEDEFAQFGEWGEASKLERAEGKVSQKKNPEENGDKKSSDQESE